jgi:hypothetical protein
MTQDDERRLHVAAKRFAHLSGEEFRRGVIDEVPSLSRGRVWCLTCGHTEAVDAARCLREGWPTHCGLTMTIDSPEERAARKAKR